MAFLGTAGFSVPALRACAERAEVVAVVTQPERLGSRGRPAPRPVAEAARDLGISIRQPDRLREAAATDEILGLGLDAVVVAAYGQILPARLLEGLPLGGINVHASLLPRWRGAAPVAAAILAGDEVTGVSIMRMDAGIDTGPVYARRALAVEPGDTTPALTARLAELGAALLADTLPRIAGRELEAEPQDEASASLAPRLSRSDGVVDWGALSAADVDRRVRALNPWPGVVAPLAGAEVHILTGHPLEGTAGADADPATPGTIVRSDRRTVAVAAAGGTRYGVDTLRPPGGRTMDAAAFLRGRRFRVP